jgi:DNA modification methylase
MTGRPTAVLIGGDARELPLADASVQCVVTSPPYWGLRDYGLGPDTLGLEPTPELYVAHLVAVFREVRRVLRADGTCWLNLGDSYNSPASNQQNGEPRPSRAGAFHSQGRRDRDAPGLKPKDLVGIPWRVAFALQADGWWLRSDIVWAKPNPMPESVTDRPTKAHEYLFLLTKSARYYYDGEAIREPNADTPLNGRVVEHKGGVKFGLDRPGAVDASPLTRPRFAERFVNPAGRNRRSVWTIATEPYPEAHFAVFPEKLVEPCILAGSKSGDRVLDPFAGSGTTVAVAERLGRVGVGVELKPEYLGLGRRRTVQAGLL